MKITQPTNMILDLTNPILLDSKHMTWEQA
jgi:hypothetical protein